MTKKFCNILIEFGVIALIIFPPIFFGAVLPKHILYIEILIFSLGLVWLVKTITKGTFTYLPTPLDLPFFLFLLLGIANWYNSIYHHNTEKEVYLFAFYALLYFLLVQQLKTLRRIVGLAFIIVLVGSGEALFGLFQYLQGATAVLGFSIPNIGTVNATYINHNHFAGFLVMIIPLALGLLIGTTNLEKKFFVLLLSGIMGAALVLSLSRGGLLSFFVAVGGALLCILRKNQRSLNRHWPIYLILVLLVILGVAAYVMFVGVSSIAHRSLFETFFPQKEAFEQEIRFAIWHSALPLVKEFPLRGSGLGNFQFVFPRYRPPQVPQDSKVYHAHNDYLELWIEMGFPALLLACWAIIRLYREALRSYFQQSDPILTSLILGGLASITALLVHSFWDFNLHIPANALLFFIMLALTTSASQLITQGSGRSRRHKRKGSRHEETPATSHKSPSYRFKASWIFGILVLVILSLLGFHFRTIPASRHYNEAKTFHNQGMLFPAIPWYNKAISRNTNNADFYESFGQLYSAIAKQAPHADKWYNLAISQFQQAIKLNNYYAAYYYQLGWSYAALNMPQEAIEQFQKAIVYDPKISFYYEQLGNYYLSLKMQEPATEMYQQALYYQPKRLKDIIENCRAYDLNYGIYRQFIPENAESRKHFAALLAEKKDWKNSKLEYRLAIELSGHAPAYYDAMLEACRRKRDEQCRQELWQELWEQNPEKLDYPLLIAESFETHQQEEKALTLYQQLLDRHPEFEQGYWRLAELYQTQGQPEKALDIYTQLLKQQPENIKIYHKMAGIHKQQKNQRAAIEIYEEALQKGLDNKEVHQRLGTLYLQDGQETRGREQYEYAMQKGETDIELYRQLERLYQEQGNKLEAELLWENYMLTNKHHPENLFKLVRHYHEQGEWLKAVTLVKEVIANAPTKVNYRKFLATLYEEEGMLEETIAQYRRILRIQPDNPDAKKQLYRLGG